MNKQALLFYPLLGVVLLVLFVGGLAYGAVPIPLDHVMDILLGKGSDKIAWQNIVLQSRLPQAITALLAGASLATSGLLLQTLFRNPLAGPSILGISDGLIWEWPLSCCILEVRWGSLRIGRSADIWR